VKETLDRLSPTGRGRLMEKFFIARDDFVPRAAGQGATFMDQEGALADAALFD